uniref:Secreted RxLR effector peptide protein n=1 Tax=Bursaphelenchus xylophilus TaxID=6326 RepID=A0A1I7SRK4_BURXY
MSTVWKALCVLSLVSLAHCAYSAAQHRSFLRLVQKEFTSLPLDIVIQTFVSLLVAVFACAHIAGEFQYIRNDQTADVIFSAQERRLEPGGQSRQLLHLRTSRKMLPAKVRLIPRAFRRSAHSSAQTKNLDPLHHCRQLVHRHDYEHFLTIQLIKDNEIKSALLSILSLNVEISLIRAKIRPNSGVDGINQLKFWKDSMKILAGLEKGPVPRQPTIKALQANCKIDQTKLILLENLVTARQQTLGDRPFKDMTSLEEHSKLLNSSLIQLLASELGSDSNSEALKNVADKIGVSLGVTTLMRATLPLLKEGVVMLPQDLLQIHGLTPDRVYNNKNPEAFKALVKDLYSTAEISLKSARKLSAEIPATKRPAFMASALKIDHALKCVKRADYSLFTKELQQHGPFAATVLWWRFKRNRF